MELVAKLRQREADGNPVKVGVVGCGQMGSGLCNTINSIAGMAVKAVADIRPQLAIKTLYELGLTKDDIVISENRSQAEDAIRKNMVVVTEDAMLLTQLEGLDVNVEATGYTDIGALFAWASIESKKPVVMLNVETDVTIGYLLNHQARKTGALYTVASGDEPGVCKMLYEQAVLQGFEVVCLGKGKNNPIKYDVTPDECGDEAANKDMNPKMLCSFIDGTKTMVEMAAVSNATGLLPDVPGMHGPKVEIPDLYKIFIPKEDGGIFSRRGAVDYSTGKVAPGVFAIVYAATPHLRKDMEFLTKAEGPYYLQYRPYHNCNVETPQSIAELVLLKEITVTSNEMNAEVVCTAKHDIRAGEKVTGIGGADIRGQIFTYAEARKRKAVALGIAADGTAKRDIKAQEIMTEENFAPDETTVVYRLRKQQDALLAGKG
jgi:predicted homoserine dehydrogenase-like protein